MTPQERKKITKHLLPSFLTSVITTDMLIWEQLLTSFNFYIQIYWKFPFRGKNYHQKEKYILFTVYLLYNDLHWTSLPSLYHKALNCKCGDFGPQELVGNVWGLSWLGMLLAPRGYRPEMPLDNLKCIWQLSTTKTYLAQNIMSAEAEKPQALKKHRILSSILSNNSFLNCKNYWKTSLKLSNINWLILVRG